jgi:hypothetical protein
MGTGDMENAFKRSLNDPAGFWAKPRKQSTGTRSGKVCWTRAGSRFIAGSPAAR